jgi:hypothetical protein
MRLIRFLYNNFPTAKKSLSQYIAFQLGLRWATMQ